MRNSSKAAGGRKQQPQSPASVAQRNGSVSKASFGNGSVGLDRPTSPAGLVSRNGVLGSSGTQDQESLPLVQASNSVQASARSGHDAVPLLQVSVCGKRINVSRAKARESLQSLQAMVRTSVGMEAHCFCFSDVNGLELLTDDQILDAIDAGRVPLQASLSDVAVHDLEQRQEELAQMQWRVMRDQLTGVKASVKDLGSKIVDVRDELEVARREQHSTLEKLRVDVTDMVTQLSKRVDNCISIDVCDKITDRLQMVSQLVQSEANTREASLRGVEHKIERIHNVLNEDRELRSRETAAVNQRNQASKIVMENALEAETRARHDLGDALTRDVHTIHERFTSLAAAQAEEVQERSVQVATLRESADRALTQSVQDALKQAHFDAQILVDELSHRLSLVEDALASVETQATQAGQRWASGVERISEQYNQMTHSVETQRLQTRNTAAMAKAQRSKSEDILSQLAQVDTMAKSDTMQEKHNREDSLRSLYNNLLSQQQAALAEVEARLHDKVDQERKARTTAIVEVLEGVGSVLEKEVPYPMLDDAEQSGRLANAQAANSPKQRTLSRSSSVGAHAPRERCLMMNGSESTLSTASSLRVAVPLGMQQGRWIAPLGPQAVTRQFSSTSLPGASGASSPIAPLAVRPVSTMLGGRNSASPRPWEQFWMPSQMGAGNSSPRLVPSRAGSCTPGAPP